jgi:hypothetical protein
VRQVGIGIARTSGNHQVLFDFFQEVAVATGTLSAEAIFEKYHRFDDGYLLAFEYQEAVDGTLSFAMTFNGRDNWADGNVWRHVRVVIDDVRELSLSIFSSRIRRIYLSVKLLKFDGLWCVDVNGMYGGAEDPRSLDEVRRDGEFYVLGGHVRAEELPEHEQRPSGSIS